ncbi:Spore coat protein I [Clostridium liquoris]|jgi:CotS family spore coat protein|uniref:Spore coat protein I n=1 Tax=Clostridium liquoris TaxID=1289519 RepID=A0A2T0B4S1_9CLOT|nr:CotS family spore coat protein [Clostridium liquoris]PRR78884.1 Spore coat protein I [Clostridium liquoris]
MGDRKIVQYIDELTDKEKVMIKKVLGKYNFNVQEITKVRSAYKITTDLGPVCLKKIRHSQKKAINGNILVEELERNGFYYTAKFYKTKGNYLFVKDKKMFFYVTEWIEGEECDLNDINEACNCVKFLAKFHIATSKIDTRKLKVKNNLKNWPRIFNNNLSDLERYKKIIEKKRIKSEFDTQYESYIDSFYNRGVAAIQLLNASDYYLLSRRAGEKRTLCHDSFYYQNIIKKDNEYYIIDLDSIIIDLHINDLGKLIRRLMFKKAYQWDFDKAKILIEAYSEINKISKSELEAMLSMIAFPHKFWKLGKKRYLKHKAWSETKYINKLNKLVRYDNLQQKFLEDYISYINAYKD